MVKYLKKPIDVPNETIAIQYSISLETINYYNKISKNKLELIYTVDKFIKMKNKLKIIERSLKIKKIIN